jgi:hypothetical protein
MTGLSFTGDGARVPRVSCFRCHSQSWGGTSAYAASAAPYGMQSTRRRGRRPSTRHSTASACGAPTARKLEHWSAATCPRHLHDDSDAESLLQNRRRGASDQRRTPRCRPSIHNRRQRRQPKRYQTSDINARRTAPVCGDHRHRLHPTSSMPASALVSGLSPPARVLVRHDPGRRPPRVLPQTD